MALDDLFIRVINTKNGRIILAGICHILKEDTNPKLLDLIKRADITAIEGSAKTPCLSLRSLAAFTSFRGIFKFLELYYFGEEKIIAKIDPVYRKLSNIDKRLDMLRRLYWSMVGGLMLAAVYRGISCATDDPIEWHAVRYMIILALLYRIFQLGYVISVFRFENNYKGKNTIKDLLPNYLSSFGAKIYSILKKIYSYIFARIYPSLIARDVGMAYNLLTLASEYPNSNIVAFVGAGHIEPLSYLLRRPELTKKLYERFKNDYVQKGPIVATYSELLSVEEICINKNS